MVKPQRSLGRLPGTCGASPALVTSTSDEANATTRFHHRLDRLFRRASNVGSADAEIVEGHYRGIPFLTIAPPTSVRLESIASWMLPTHRAMTKLVDFGRDCAERALSARTLGGEPARAHRPTVAVTQAPAERDPR